MSAAVDALGQVGGPLGLPDGAGDHGRVVIQRGQVSHDADRRGDWLIGGRDWSSRMVFQIRLLEGGPGGGGGVAGNRQPSPRVLQFGQPAALSGEGPFGWPPRFLAERVGLGKVVRGGVVLAPGQRRWPSPISTSARPSRFIAR